jgi:hypothetical protein
MSDIRLTDNLRAMLCLLDDTDGLPPKKGLLETNPALATELMRVLEALGFAERGEYTSSHGWVYRLNETGKERARTTRYHQNSSSCQSCVKVHCVCRLSLVCLKGEGHGGCNGSHD